MAEVSIEEGSDVVLVSGGVGAALVVVTAGKGEVFDVWAVAVGEKIVPFTPLQLVNKVIRSNPPTILFRIVLQATVLW